MDTRISPDDVALLRAAGLAEDDVAHSILVAEAVLAVVDDMALPIELDTAVRGAVFHDIGKARDASNRHGVAGAAMVRELGLPEAVADCVRKHVRAGPPPEEAAGYGLPPGDYRHVRLEEKLVAYADKLTDILEEGDLAESLADARARFPAILAARPGLAKDGPTLARYLAIHAEVEEGKQWEWGKGNPF